MDFIASFLENVAASPASLHYSFLFSIGSTLYLAHTTEAGRSAVA